LAATAVSPFSTVETGALRRADRIVAEILAEALLVKAAPEDARLAAFRERYTSALSKVLRGQFERFEAEGLRGEIDEIMAFAEKAFGAEVAERLRPETERYLRRAFRVGQAVQFVPEKIQTLWDKPRQEALDWLVEHDRFWIGKVFPEHLAGDFRDTITEGLTQGLGRRDIGRRLRDMVLGRGGVPAKQEYYTRVAATSVNRARNWGAVFSLREAGFTEYEIRAVMDERTSAICRFMNGKVFRVRDAMDTVQRALSGPPSAIERIAPWPRYDAKRRDHYLTVGGSRHYLSGKSSRWLAERGLSLPPYHGNCRTIYLVTRRQFEEHREVVEPAAPPFDVSELEPVRMRLDGMHEKQVFRDREGGRWLFKPVGRGEEFRAWGDRAAAELAERLGLPTPEVYVTEIGGRTGSLQRMFDAAGSFRGVNPTALTAEELAAIQREHVFDWLISNHDGHAGNFLRLADGRTVAIDKGQLYRFFGKDRLDVGYVPNPERSLYSEVFGAYARGEDVKLLPPSHREIEGLLKRIEALPDEEFRRILSPYARRAAEAGRLAFETEEAFLARAVARKRALRDDLAAFYRKIERARRKALGAGPGAAPITKVDAAFVRKVKASGTRGQSLLVAGEDFENMNVLVYHVEGKGLFLEGKLRGASQAKLLQRLGLDAGALEPDPYWERVLKLAKSYNHHLGPGGDGKIPDHTVKLWRELARELKKDRSARARSYRRYVSALAKESRGEVVWSTDALGRKVKPYVPRRRKLPEGVARRFPTETTEAWDYQKEARAGRIRLKGGRRTFAGTAYDVDLGDGVRLHYVQHGDRNRFSKFGKIRVEVAGEGPAEVRRMLEKLEELGLDARLATAEDMELLYLSKVSYAAGVLDEVPITPEMTVRQRIRAFREFWEKRLGVDDLAKVKGYEPLPRFDEGKGWARWSRFDVDAAEFERRMKGYALGHDLHADVADAIEAILDSEGSLVATEEKFRIGVPIRGMSPDADQRTGGASYVFTRIAGPGRARRFDVVLDKRLLLDPDTISYDSDYFGRVEPDFLAAHRKRTVADWIAAARRSANETLVRNHIPLVEYVERINVRSAAERRRVLDSFRKRGITRIRGKPIEDVVQVR
jgi:SPP1 gp7 family putative phage head morphogenesis protein